MHNLSNKPRDVTYGGHPTDIFNQFLNTQRPKTFNFYGFLSNEPVGNVFLKQPLILKLKTIMRIWGFRWIPWRQGHCLAFLFRLWWRRLRLLRWWSYYNKRGRLVRLFGWGPSDLKCCNRWQCHLLWQWGERRLRQCLRRGRLRQVNGGFYGPRLLLHSFGDGWRHGCRDLCLNRGGHGRRQKRRQWHGLLAGRALLPFRGGGSSPNFGSCPFLSKAPPQFFTILRLTKRKAQRKRWWLRLRGREEEK